MKNFKMKKKLIVSFGIVLMLFVISTISVSISLSITKYQLQQFYNVPWQTKGVAQELLANLAEQQKNLFRAIATTDESIIKSALEDVDKYGQSIQNNLSVLESKALAENMAILNELKNKVMEWDKIKETAIKMAEDTTISSDVISNYMKDNSTKVINELNNTLNSAINITSETGKNMISSTSHMQTFSIILLVIMCSASIVAGIFLCLYLTKEILKPLKELEMAADQMAEGNLNVTVEYVSKDELGSVANSIRMMSERIAYYMRELASAMRQLASGDLNVKPRESFLGDFKVVQLGIRELVHSLNSVMKDINEASKQVDTGSSQLAESAQELAKGATEQASAVGELESTIETVVEQVKNNTKQSKEVSKKTIDVKKEAEESNHKMTDMAAAMERISQTSLKIQDIIVEIEEIASMTNLLSLNAAIEAARAGEAGKGFAVVAEQIRTLANDSAQSAVNTRQLIETSIHEVENGNVFTEQTVASLAKVMNSLNDIANLSDLSRISSENQEKAMSEIQIGIEQISSVVQNNSATAEETSATSEELYAQAATLSEVVSKFKLRE